MSAVVEYWIPVKAFGIMVHFSEDCSIYSHYYLLLFTLCHSTLMGSKHSCSISMQCNDVWKRRTSFCIHCKGLHCKLCKAYPNHLSAYWVQLVIANSVWKLMSFSVLLAFSSMLIQITMRRGVLTLRLCPSVTGKGMTRTRHLECGN